MAFSQQQNHNVILHKETGSATSKTFGYPNHLPAPAGGDSHLEGAL